MSFKATGKGKATAKRNAGPRKGGVKTKGRVKGEIRAGDVVAVKIPTSKEIIVANPPWMGGGKLKSELAEVARLSHVEELPPMDFFGEEEKRLAERLVTDVSTDNPDVNALCETYRLKREELGRLTGFSLRALADWANDKLPSQPARRRLREVRRLLDALAEVVKVESIPKWLHRTNPEFAPLTPLQVIELGEIDRLWAMVYHLGSGQLD